MKRNAWITGLRAGGAVLSVLHRYGKYSGATWKEYRQTLPGDEMSCIPIWRSPTPSRSAPPVEEIWPWLIQLGYYRAGWFTDSPWQDWDYYSDRIMRFLSGRRLGSQDMATVMRQPSDKSFQNSRF